MSDELVTLATFETSIKAEFARAALTEAGIESQLGDDNLATMLPSNAVGGVKLVVRQTDADRALAVYKSIEDHLHEDIIIDDDELTRQALAAVPEDGTVEPDEETKE